MSNTMIKINRYKTLSQTMTRLSHNKRKKSFDKRQMLNLNEEIKDIKVVGDNNQPKPLSKTSITNKIAKLNYRLKQYHKQRNDLYGMKLQKKQKQILKLQKDIEALKKQRNNTASQMNYAKKSYVEFVLTITKAPKIYKKDIAFANELKKVSMMFLNNKFSADICNIDIHLDQSTPHLHVMSRYIGNNSLQKDLDELYTKKRYQYSDLQLDFNAFITEHFNLKKFNKLKIEEITQGGKREYLPLSEYKALNSQLNKKVQKEINTILSNTQVISKLFDENHIKENDYHNLLKKYKIVKKHYYFLKQLTDKNESRKMFDELKIENDKLHQELEALKRQNNKSSLYEKTIQDIFGKEIINLSTTDYNIATQEKITDIISLAKQNKTLSSKLNQSNQKLEDIKIDSQKQKQTILSLKNDISIKENIIKQLKELIIKSKMPSLINALSNIGANISKNIGR